MRLKRFFGLLYFFISMVFSGFSSAAEVDSGIPAYEVSSGVSGNLSSVGSDTLANLMTLWAEEFKRFYPNVNIQVQAAGSSTAPPALTERTSNLGPMSREMKDNEIESFETRFGYKPTGIPVAIDALAVYVHKDNPLGGMTIAQVDAVFSSNRRCGYSQDLNKWGALAMRGPWEARDIQLFGRNSVSGTYGYFKDTALCAGDFKNNVNEQPGSASVVQSVSTAINGIGYSGIGYRTSGVRALPIARDADADYSEATAENSVAGNYPLARFLYVYVNKAPNTDLPPLEREFIKLIMSQQGQDVVVKDGYIPLPQRVVTGTLDTLGIK
jgi:phosphate transport system substrate-binding protein